MFEITFSNIAIAFGTSLAAGLSIVLGSGLMVFSRIPSPCALSFRSASVGGVMVYMSLTETSNRSSETLTQVCDKDKTFAAATLAFLAGVGLIALIDRIMPNPHKTLDLHGPTSQENRHRHIAYAGMMAAFVTIAHNFPGDLAMFFTTLENPVVGIPLALVIVIYDISEGISIAAPIYFAACNRKKAVLACLALGLTEPLGVVLGHIILKPFLSPFVLDVVFGVIASVMVFLTLDELLPVAKRYFDGRETVYGLTSGMAVIVLSLVLFYF